ncbi:MAG TPA: histidine kinase, partial [Bacteroidia bacterium]|nr:histidine kinase [Bacteroidia bacterium]
LDALAYLEGSDDASLKGEVHETFGNLEFNGGNFQQAISHYLIARGHFMQMEWPKRIAGSNNTIGICFDRLGRKATAKAYFTEAYRLADSIQNPGIAAAAMSHLAGIDHAAGQFRPAIVKYRHAIALDLQAPSPTELHGNYLGMSKCHLALGQPDSARHYVERAFEEAQRGKDGTRIAETQLEQAKLSMAEKQYSAAMAAIKEATKGYAGTRNAAGLQQAWALNSQCSEAMGDIQGALKAERMARQWQDSVQAFSAYTQLLALEAKYWSEKKQHSLEIAKQNEALQAKEAERALEAGAKLAAQRNLLVSALALTVIFGAVLYWTNAKRRKNQLERKLSELRMTALRAQMNPHFIFNALGSVQLLINTSAIREANLYLSKFAQLLRMTLERSGAEDSTLQDEIEALRLYIDLEALRFKFSYTIEVGEDIDAEALHFPTLLLQPIVENAVKHGLAATSAAGQLKIAFAIQGKDLLCVIEDNGVGRGGVKKRSLENAGTRRSFGIQITQERLTLLQPSRADRLQIIDLTHADGRAAGTRVELRLPLKPQ